MEQTDTIFHHKNSLYDTADHKKYEQRDERKEAANMHCPHPEFQAIKSRVESALASKHVDKDSIVQGQCMGVCPPAVIKTHK